MNLAGTWTGTISTAARSISFCLILRYSNGFPIAFIGPDPEYQALADAEIVEPRRHVPMRLAVARALGGTSLVWGGRCVP